MTKNDNDAIKIRFQWSTDDLPGLRRHIKAELKNPAYPVISFFARLSAFALTGVVAYFFVPGVDFWIVVLISVVGSTATWVSWITELHALRHLEIMQAQDACRVGYQDVLLNRNGIIWATDTSQQYTSWLGVHEIIEDDTGILLRTGGISGLFLPQRVFNSHNQRTEVAGKLRLFQNEKTLPIKLVPDSAIEKPATQLN